MVSRSRVAPPPEPEGRHAFFHRLAVRIRVAHEMLRLAVASAGRQARAPAALRARSMGFLADLRKKVGEELSKNAELQKSLKEFGQHDAIKSARETAKSATEALKQAGAKAGELASEAKSKVRARARPARAPGARCISHMR